MKGIFGVVILYNPSGDLIGNIRSYVTVLDLLIVIDNSDKDHAFLPVLRNHFPSIQYVKNDDNVGIAKALNQAAAIALKEKGKWLLTMDQDSRFAEGSIEKLVAMTDVVPTDIAIITPVHVNKDVVLKPYAQSWQLIKKTMTSGNLLNLKAFETCGPFEEKLFIDYVDHEYNFRLRKAGFKLVLVNTSHLLHNLGDIDSYKFAFFSMKTTNHSADRRYYISRNRLYVICKYFTFAPKFFFKELHQQFVDCLRILFLEKNKASKFRAVMAGTKDWLFGNYGKRRKTLA